MTQVPGEEQHHDAVPGEDGESTGHAGLDKRLEQGAVDFNRGIDAAQVWVSAFLVVLLGVLLHGALLALPLHGPGHDLLSSGTGVLDALDEMPEAPLSLFGIAFNAWLPGNPFAFRAVSLALHLANAILLYLLARGLFGGRGAELVPALAGLLLVAHPAAVSNVNLAAGRPELQSLFFALAAMLLFVRATPDASATRPFALLGALACYLAAAASHAALAVLPVFTLWFDVLRHGVPALRRRADVHGAAFLVLVLVIAIYGAQETGGGTGRAADFARVWTVTAQGVQQALHAAVSGGDIAALPAGAAGVGGGLAGMALLCVAAAALALLALRSAAGLALFWVLALACGMACMLPANTALAGGRLYLPLAGLFLLAPWLINLFEGQRVRVALGAGGAVLVLLAAAATYQRNVLWAEPRLLWTAAAEEHPASPWPWQYLAEIAGVEANVAEPDTRVELHRFAAGCWEEALVRAPGDARLQVELGLALLRTGRVERAFTELSAAVRANPFDTRAAAGFARAGNARMRVALVREIPAMLERTGRPERFAAPLRAVLLKELRDPAAYNELSRVMAAADDARAALVRDAATGYSYAGRMDALDDEDLLDYGLILAALGNVPASVETLGQIEDPGARETASALLRAQANLRELAERAETQSEQAMSREGKALEALYRKGEAHFFRGAFLAAAYMFESVAGRLDDNEPAWVLLGVARAELGQPREFIEQHRDALPPAIDFWKRLGAACAARGLWDAAEQYMARAPGAPAELDRLVALGEVAMAVNSAGRAEGYLRGAAEAAPEDPLPWLRLTDLALMQEQLREAARRLAEAERRGAWDEEVAARRAQLEGAGVGPEVVPPPAGAPPRTIIR